MTVRPFEGNELLKFADRMRSFFVGRDEVVWRAADVYNSAAQAIPAAAFTALTMSTVVTDTDGFYNGAAPTRLTCKVNGWYIVTARCALDFDPAGAGIERLLTIYLNTTLKAIASYGTLAGKPTYMSISAVFFMNANQYVETQVLQAGAGVVNTLAGYPALTLARLP